MPRAGVYILASLISGVSAALILASGPSYTDARSPHTAYNVKRGQSAYDGCRASPCQTAYLNSLEDFCLWAPSQPDLSATRNTEHTLVAWCTKNAHGTRLIPDGTISGARFVITPEYVQIIGVGDLTNINVPADGVASASGEGDRVHDLVFTRAHGQLEQIYDWTSFVSQERFCFRACKPSAAASTTCTRIYDISGCSENIPGNYDSGVFDAPEVPATLYQEVLAAPIRPLSGYTTYGTVGDAQVARARRAIASTSGSIPSARSHSHSTALTSSMGPTTTDTATTVTFPSFPTSTLTAAAFTNSISSTPLSSATLISAPYSYSSSHIHSHWHSDTYRHSRHRSSTSSASVSSSSSHHSLTYSQSASSTASSLSDPSSMSSATPSFALTFSTYSSLDPSSSKTSTTSTPIPTSTAPTSTSFFPSSSDGTSSSGVSSYQSSSSSTATPTSPSTSSQSSDVLTFTTSHSSSSVPTTSTTTSQHSQTQLGSQCPPPSQNAGSVVPSPAPLFPLMLTILMIVLSSVGALII